MDRLGEFIDVLDEPSPAQDKLIATQDRKGMKSSSAAHIYDAHVNSTQDRKGMLTQSATDIYYTHVEFKRVERFSNAAPCCFVDVIHIMEFLADHNLRFGHTEAEIGLLLILQSRPAMALDTPFLPD